MKRNPKLFNIEFNPGAKAVVALSLLWSFQSCLAAMPCVEFNHRSLEGSGHEQNRKNFQTDFQNPTLPRNQREFLFALKDRLKIPTERSLNVIVIGGASGIGAEFSRIFFEMGANVLTISRNSQADAARLNAQWSRPANRSVGTFRGLNFDLSVDGIEGQSAIRQFLRANSEAMDSADVVINSAGILAFDNDPEGVRRMKSLKAFGAASLIKHLANGGRDRKKRFFLQVSSISALLKLGPPVSAYTDSNQVLIGLTQELAQRGHLAFAITPGLVDTPLTRSQPAIHPEYLKAWGDSPEQMVSSALDLLTASFKDQKPQPNLPDFVLLPGNPANMKFLEAYRIASKYLRQEEIDTLWWELFRVGLTSPPRSPKEAIERIHLIMVAINSAAELDRNISKSKVLRATTALSKPIWFGFYRTAIRSF